MTPGRALAIGVVAATVVGVTTSVRAGAAAALALACLATVLIVDRRTWRWVLAGLSIVVTAAAHAARARDGVLASPLVLWVDAHPGRDRAPTPVVVDGVLTRDAEAVDRGARLLIDVIGVDDGLRRYAVHGRLQAFVAGDLVPAFIQHWRAGRPVRAPVILRRPQTWINPGGRSARWQALSRRFDVTGTIKSATVVSVERGTSWNEAAAGIRVYVRRAATRVFGVHGDQTRAIVVAVLIGDRAGLDADLEQQLQIAGTYHVIAISGGNVAIVTALSLVALRMLFRSPRAAWLLTMTVVAMYGWTVGGDPSVRRAVTAALVYLACGLTGLVPAALDVLALVAVLVLFAEPLSIVDAGAWLSFGATFGIILCAARLATWSAAGAGLRPIRHRVALSITGLLGATIAAELVLLPVAAAVFSRVGVAGLALNFVAIPMIAVVQVAGAGAVALAAWSDRAAALAGVVAHAAATMLVDSSRLVEVFPWLSWRVPPPSAGAIIAFYVSGAGWLCSTGRRALRTGAAATFAAAALVIVIAPGTGRARPPSGWLRFTMMDVGQGEAQLIQFPAGQSLLVDAASATAGFDVGERVVTPALWASGLTRLDWLAVTHPDLDHIGGSPAVVAGFRPREVWEGVPVPSDAERRTLQSVVAARRVPWRQLQRGDRLEIGSVGVDVLNPPIPDWERQRARNDDSIVLRVRYGDVELLLTGDIGVVPERDLLAEADQPPLRVLKVAHHGSRSSSSAVFLGRYRPHVALVSAGRGNPFGHPAPETLDRLVAAGAQIFRTDRDGAIIVETDGRELVVRSMTGRRWTMEVWRQTA